MTGAPAGRVCWERALSLRPLSPTEPYAQRGSSIFPRAISIFQRALKSAVAPALSAQALRPT
jgi:hypothetical protein